MKSEIRKRRITITDGRYLIFYTFDQDPPQPNPPAGEIGSEPKTESKKDPDV